MLESYYADSFVLLKKNSTFAEIKIYDYEENTFLFLSVYDFRWCNGSIWCDWEI